MVDGVGERSEKGEGMRKGRREEEARGGGGRGGEGRGEAGNGGG